MPSVYVVPGIGGTSLGTSPAANADTWVSYTAFAFGYIGRMRLAPNGVNPGPPDGVQLYPGAPLPDYYARCLAALRQQLGAQGFTVKPWGYDWRVDAQALGAGLAGRIRNAERASDPCTVVAHSYGGLVARLAWSSLVASGQSNLVRRLVTLGSPHWGSYGAVRLWSLDSDELQQVFYLSIPAAIVSASTNPFVPGRVWTPTQLAALAGTFPCLYWTMPSLLAPDASTDPNRSVLYGSGWPPGRGVDPNWLNQARTVWQPLLASPATLPPSWVLTAVAGVGLPTPAQLHYPQLLGSPGGYYPLGEGDGTVVTSSALLAGGAEYTITCSHMDLPTVTAESGMLAAWILDPRGPPAPPPPPVVVPGQLGQVSAGPPSPLPIFASAPIPRDP